MVSIDYRDMGQDKIKCKTNDYTKAEGLRKRARVHNVEEFLRIIYSSKKTEEKKNDTIYQREVDFLKMEQEFLTQFASQDLSALPKKLDKKSRELIGKLCRLEEIIYTDTSRGSTRFYRGQREKSWCLNPAIYRKAEDNDNGDNNGLVKYESQIFSETISNFPEEFSNCENPFEQLVKMQHYSVPTRLLDITTNPLVALFFACQGVKVPEEKNKNVNDSEVLAKGLVKKNDDCSVVYVFDVPNHIIKYGDSDSVTILSTLAKYDHYWGKEMFKSHTKTARGYFTGVRFLHAVRETKPWFRSKIRKKTLCSVFCVKPKHANPRIIRQSGAFFLFGIDKVLGRDQPASLRGSGITVKRIQIPHKSAKGILRQLEDLNISRASLFGDLDYYAEHITDKYKEKQRNDQSDKKTVEAD